MKQKKAMCIFIFIFATPKNIYLVHIERKMKINIMGIIYKFIYRYAELYLYLYIYL